MASVLDVLHAYPIAFGAVTGTVAGLIVVSILRSGSW